MIALAAFPTAAIIVIWPFASCVGGGIDVGIARHDGECVGVTDGRYKFSAGFTAGEVGDETRRRLDRVEDLIKDQNDIEGDFVRVAFLAPLTSPLSGPRAVDELEGVAAAHKWINRDGQGSPKIQLLIAHMGSAEKQWQPVVQQLIAMKDDQAPLVAVIGLGLSQDETKLAARQLETAGIPMVASSLTATELDPENKVINGFHQVSHTNGQQVDVMFQYLHDSGVDLRNAVVVKNEDESDTYTSSYAAAIAERLSLEQGRTPVPELFGDPDNDQGKLRNQFRLISQSLCQDQRAVIFYAGRSRFLSNFMQQLESERCLASALVVSGSDAAVLRMMSGDEIAQRNWGIAELDEVLSNDKVSLLYTTQADPTLLGERPLFQELEDAFRAEGFNENDLRTRWAIMGWDALRLTATMGVASPVGSEPGIARRPGRDTHRHTEIH